MTDKIRHHTITNILGVFCLLLGLLVLIGWLNHWIFLIQIHPRFSPMQFNTALCFVLSGIALILLNNNLNKWSYIPIALVIIMAGTTLIEYTFNLNLGIDQLFIQAYLTNTPKYPGRMAPNTTMGFIFIAVTLFMMSYSYSPRYAWIYLFNSFLIISLGFLTFIGYFTDYTLHYGIGQWIKIALHTAIGLIILGFAIICYVYSKNKNNYLPLAPLFITFIIFNTVFMGWQSIKRNQENYFNILLNIKINSIGDIITAHMQERVSSFSRITYRWLTRENTPEKEWREDIRHYIHDQRGYSAIEWIDKNYRVNWVEPQVGNEDAEEFNLASYPKLQEISKQSIEEENTLLSSPVNLKLNEQRVLLFSPILKQDTFYGFMLGIINPQIMLGHIIDQTDF
ncbi:MAG: hypothetical protein EPN84_05515, partial [Legionella sp.]